MGKLSAAKVRTLSKPGAYADGNGLYLQVRTTNGNVYKSWIFRYMRNGKAHNMGLGSIRVVTLVEARLAASEAQKQLFHGIDPLKAKHHDQAPSTVTFSHAAETYIDTHKAGWKNQKHIVQWTNTLKLYAEPVIGDFPVNQIDRSHIVTILEPIWIEKAETATRVRGRIEKILDWAAVEGHRTSENPARWKGNLEHSLPKRPKTKKVVHHAAMSWKELPAFYKLLCSQEGVAALALRFTILTAARTSEVRFATPEEFDLENKVWTVPAERMKAGKEHRVPLTSEVIALLENRTSSATFVFSPFSDRAMSENAMLALLRRLGMKGITVHGFRSTFRDWAADTTATPSDVVEACLAHKNQNLVEAAYLRSDYFEKRRDLLAAWSSFALG